MTTKVDWKLGSGKELCALTNYIEVYILDSLEFFFRCSVSSTNKTCLRNITRNPIHISIVSLISHSFSQNLTYLHGVFCDYSFGKDCFLNNRLQYSTGALVILNLIIISAYSRKCTMIYVCLFVMFKSVKPRNNTNHQLTMEGGKLWFNKQTKDTQLGQ